MSKENFKTVIKLTKSLFDFSYHHEPVILSKVSDKISLLPLGGPFPPHQPPWYITAKHICAKGPALKLPGSWKDKDQVLARKNYQSSRGEKAHTLRTITHRLSIDWRLSSHTTGSWWEPSPSPIPCLHLAIPAECRAHVFQFTSETPVS